MQFITDPFFYFIAIPAVLLVGIAKGGFAGSIGSITVPLMSFAVDPVTAAAILLPILCVMDLFSAWNFRRSFDVSHLKILVPGSVVGITLAALLMGKLTEDHIRIMVGVIAISFCLNHWLRLTARSYRPGKTSGYFWGALAGFTSTQVHAGGPPLSVYMFPQRLEKKTMIGTMVMFFFFINYVKLIPYSYLDLLTTRNLMTSLILMPVAPLGIWLGYWLLHRLSEKLVYRILYVSLFMLGVKMILEGTV
ncbi:MAG: sulfite exporter TauE/SafE family protein [Gammaproteobacteria bacterium]|nr:sulfite exporter TauE/SafE family protein [Gammaproteobacteria bacterium]